MSKNTIEINGKLYDAVTGKVVSLHPAKSNVPPKKPNGGQVVDGFTRHPSATIPVKAVPKKVAIRTEAPKSPKKTQKSHTLMRTAVRKPHSAGKPLNHNPTKTHLANPQREVRAQHVSKSKLISKFGSIGALRPVLAPLEVQPEPSAPVFDNLMQHAQAVVASTVHGTHQKSGSSNTFERALHNATSHQQIHHKHKKRGLSHAAAKKLNVSHRAVKISSGLAVALLVIGFFAYQNAPNLAMKVASTRAGINAKLPDYKPSGFAMNGAIQYSPGQILVSYKSNSDERNFKLSQQSTDLTNESLLTERVASANKPYQTFQDKGKTIYIYDDSNATWVDNGILYHIEGESALSTDQLLRLATSL